METYGEPNSWDVSKITDMYNMFYSSQFNSDISNWNVSNVTNMSYMFDNSKFNSNISNWDIGNVIEGKDHIIQMGAVLKEKPKIFKTIRDELKECPVTRETIQGDYLQCITCSKCFDILIKDWISNNKICPYCKSNWNEIIIYSQK